MKRVYLKRYLLEHRVSRRRQAVIADSFQSACEMLGWLPAEVCVLKVEPCELTRSEPPTCQGEQP